MISSFKSNKYETKPNEKNEANEKDTHSQTNKKLQSKQHKLQNKKSSYMGSKSFYFMEFVVRVHSTHDGF